MTRPPLKSIGFKLKPSDTRRLKPPGKKPDSIYVSSEWRSLMAEIFRERGRRCEDPACHTPNGPWGALYGDHIHEIKDGGAPLDKRNVMVRCAPCHGRKTAAERLKRALRQY